MDGSSVDISVVICTRNRAFDLERTLRGLQSQRFNSDLRAEIIVVDNGSKDSTQRVLNQNWDKIVVIALYEPRVGKSRALNCALESVRGELVVFTDDDISAVSVWLAEYYHTSRCFGATSLFCGPILPLFPVGTPEWFGSHPAVFFGKFTPREGMGPLPPNIHPFGANFAARSAILRNIRFRIDLGPSAENGPMTGEDTDFLARLRHRSPECIYVPQARVFHHISRQQTHSSWLFERAFQLGRSRIMLQRQPDVIDLERIPTSASVEEKKEEMQRLINGELLNYYCGQLSECTAEEVEQRSDIESALQHLNTNGITGLLGQSALKFWEKHQRAHFHAGEVL